MKILDSGLLFWATLYFSVTSIHVRAAHEKTLPYARLNC